MQPTINKILEDLTDNKSEEFKNGFNTAITLNLPVKFVMYLAQENNDVLYQFGSDDDEGLLAFQSLFEDWLDTRTTI